MRRDRWAESVEPPVPSDPAEARLLCGDALGVLAETPSAIAQTCVTSPPYWGLRDYGVRSRVWDGEMSCRHRWVAAGRAERGGRRCRRCGAWAGCLGLEPDPGLYVKHIVAVMREVRRVLRPDGTLWLNLGDSYAARAMGTEGETPAAKPKDLLGIPWRVALALQGDGWWLRSDVIWAKSNLTPEPARDRPVHAHEYLFLLAPSRRYHYDGFAVREPARGGGMRNRRSVWTLPTAQFAGAHFASFPEALADPCVLAGTSPAACRRCGAPWRRLVCSRRLLDGREVTGDWTGPHSRLRSGRALRTGEGHSKVEVRRETVGWEPTCEHREPGARCTVLDPFAGTGTTGRVAMRHGRHFLGVELSGEYARLARRRISDASRDATKDASGDAKDDAGSRTHGRPVPRRKRPRAARRSPTSSPGRKVGS